MTDIMDRDALIRLSLLGGMARAFLIDSTVLTQRAREIHGLSRTATAALGRTLTCAAMMGSMLKGEKESLTVRINGDGGLGYILAVADGGGRVKGLVGDPTCDPPRKPNGKLDVGAAVGRGTLSVVKDLGLRDPYVGSTDLVSGEIAEDFASYFAVSEQTPSLVALGVLVSQKVEAAGGLIVQMMPGADEYAVRAVEDSAQACRDISGTIASFGLDGTAERLLGHLRPEVLDRTQPQYRCDCSRERIERMLITLGEKELRDMIENDRGTEVDCHFCRKRYSFTQGELEALLKEALTK